MNDDIQTRRGMNWRWFSIDPRRTLQQQWVFWWPIILLIGAAFGFAVPKFYWGWPDGDVYELILHNMRLPFLVASLALPVSVAIGRFHGAAQRQLANQIAESNQSFTHYYEHKKIFTAELLERYQGWEGRSEIIEIANPSYFHSLIYPNANRISADFSRTRSDILHKAINDFKRAITAMCRAYEANKDRFDGYEQSLDNRHQVINYIAVNEIGVFLANKYLTPMGLKVAAPHELVTDYFDFFCMADDAYDKCLEIALSFDDTDYTHDDNSLMEMLITERAEWETNHESPNIGSLITHSLYEPLKHPKPGKAPKVSF